MSASTHHSPVLKHHFADLGQQHACERLGMWMFLATEILFFGGVFGAYTVYRVWYPHDFEAASSHLNRMIATVNTVFLITSSLTMTLAIRSAKLGDKGGLYRNLLLTAALASAFMVMKGFEYKEDFHESYVPGVMFQTEYAAAEKELLDAEKKANAERVGRTAAEKNAAADYKPFTHEEVEKFQFSAERQPWSKSIAKSNHGKADTDVGYISPQRVQLFLCFYFVMTAIHGIHILVGIGCILWLVFETYRGTIPPENYSTVEVVSLYWHLVDGIWLFLMPLLYLAGAGMHH